MIQWTFENELLTLQDSGDLGPDRVVERPKVIYNEETSTYVLWLHIDDSSYGEAKTGVATSPSVWDLHLSVRNSSNFLKATWR